MEAQEKLDIATFGGGCFWCVEAVFERVDGVDKVVSGYSGGHVKNPSYREVCNETTGHAEVCQVYFNTDKISYKELLEIFFETHDPTTLNKQGNDVGTQYRSVIFYHSPEQKQLSESYIQSLNESGKFNKEIVTQVEAFNTFYEAEDYHQDYFENNPEQPYCSFVVAPKVKKFEYKFNEKLKK